MPESEGIFFVYVPCGSEEEAFRIGRLLVEERLAACTNIFNGLHSIYWWQDKIEEADEFLLIAKTRQSLLGKVEARVKALHSYEVPCIAALPVEKLNAAYASWILKETKAE